MEPTLYFLFAYTLKEPLKRTKTTSCFDEDFNGPD